MTELADAPHYNIGARWKVLDNQTTRALEKEERIYVGAIYAITHLDTEAFSLEYVNGNYNTRIGVTVSRGAIHGVFEPLRAPLFNVTAFYLGKHFCPDVNGKNPYIKGWSRPRSRT